MTANERFRDFEVDRYGDRREVVDIGPVVPEPVDGGPVVRVRCPDCGAAMREVLGGVRCCGRVMSVYDVLVQHRAKGK